MQLRFLIAVFSAIASVSMAQTIQVEFERQTLENGLTVIYAPLHNAPVVQTRLTYHVGSRDEDPQRQGFAHLFEHMMFRGSTHVAPEEHMKLIGAAGGSSNAFTSFDRTVYHQTVPSSATELILWLEADRMAGFKVDDQKFQTERKVVAEEWRMRYANQPLGMATQDLLRSAFTTHSYRWTPIGNMDHLAQATSSELQSFFNKYYVPNNATLVIAGDIDVAQTKLWVQKFFGWIPRGQDITRTIPAEPTQTEPRRLVVSKPNVPLTNLYIAFKSAAYASDDMLPLVLLGDVLAMGRTGRLDRALVTGASPTCVRVGAGPYQNQDPSVFMVTAVVQRGVDASTVETTIHDVLRDVAEKGVTQAELDKVRTQYTQSAVRGLQTAADIAERLSYDQVLAGDAGRINTLNARLAVLTPEDLQRVAREYLKVAASTTVIYQNGAADAVDVAAADKLKSAEVVASTAIVEPRVGGFPKDYPTSAPKPGGLPSVTFNKGVETRLDDGASVITLTDKRLPLVNVSVVFRSGSHSEPRGKEGVAQLTASLIRRGTEGTSFLELSERLESRGITIEASDAGDNTRFNVACTSDQLDFAIEQAAQVLSKPTFPADELAKIANQAATGLAQSLASPATVADRTLAEQLHAGGPSAHPPTPQSYGSVTLDDVKAWYHRVYTLDNAFVVVSGDIDAERGTQIASKLLAGHSIRTPVEKATYSFEPAPAQRQIVIVDNPQGKQSTIRLGVRAYTNQSDDRFAGTLAGDILSTGIYSRLGRYVRAEKGLTYGSRAYFRPGRQWGEFSGSVDTSPSTTAETIEAMFKVFDDLRAGLATDEELAESKTRVAGSLAMGTQTIAQQADRRIDQILNGYPVDYYDRLSDHISAVTPEQIRKVMQQYVNLDAFQIVIVAPASAVDGQVSNLGAVKTKPMPLRSPAAESSLAN